MVTTVAKILLFLAVVVVMVVGMAIVVVKVEGVVSVGGVSGGGGPFYPAVAGRGGTQRGRRPRVVSEALRHRVSPPEGEVQGAVLVSLLLDHNLLLAVELLLADLADLADLAVRRGRAHYVHPLITVLTH